MSVSIVIPIFSRTQWIKECLEALCLQEGINAEVEVIVVDDGSPHRDQIEALIKTFKAKLNLSYVYQGKKGVAAARNTGIHKSKGEIVLFLDDDSICEKNWLTEILKTFEQNTAAGIVNGKTLSYYRKRGTFSLLLESSIHKPQKRLATYNIAYRKKVLEKIGLFDEQYTLAWEDMDLGFRAWCEGVGHVYCPRAVVYHAHEKTFDDFKKKCLRHGYGLGQFTKKYILSLPHCAIGIFLFCIKDIYLAFHPHVISHRTETEEFLRFIRGVIAFKTALKILWEWRPASQQEGHICSKAP